MLNFGAIGIGEMVALVGSMQRDLVDHCCWIGDSERGRSPRAGLRVRRVHRARALPAPLTALGVRHLHETPARVPLILPMPGMGSQIIGGNDTGYLLIPGGERIRLPGVRLARTLGEKRGGQLVRRGADLRTG